jgi:predicted lysophospholipase L1 biosynthesis ABC-type transport system permease subunit
MFKLALRQLWRQRQFFAGSFVTIAVGAFYLLTLANTGITAAKGTNPDSPLYIIAILMLGICEICLIVTAFVLSNTMSMSVNLRRLDFARLRLLGATPAQVRRLTGWQVLTLTLLGCIVGEGLGLVCRQWFVAILRHYQLVQTGFTVQIHSWTLPVILAVLLLFSQLGSLAVIFKISRVSPKEATVTSVISSDRIGLIRWLIIALLTAGTIILAIAAPALRAKAQGQSPLSLIVAVAVLLDLAVMAPLFIKPMTRILLLPFKLFQPLAARLAEAELRVQRRISAAVLSGIVLSVGLAFCLPIALQPSTSGTNTIPVAVILYMLVTIPYTIISGSNLLVLNAYGNKQNILVLKKMGASRNQLMAIYSIKAFFLALLAIILAAVAGFITLIAYRFSLPPGIAPTPHFAWSFIIGAAALCTVTTVAAGVLPALKQYKLKY